MQDCAVNRCLLTLGEHAQRGLQYSFCLSVSVSVHDYSRTAGNEAASERYQQLQRNKRSKIKKKTKAFEIEKLALSRTALRDPAHQLAVWYIRVRVRTYVRAVISEYAHRATWRFL